MSQESTSEFMKGWAPIAFPGFGFIGGSMVGAYRFDLAVPYEEEAQELSMVNIGLEEAKLALTNSPESKITVESLITKNEVKIESLNATVDHYHSSSNVPESMLIGTGSGAIAAALVVGGIMIWSKKRHAGENLESS